MANICSNAMTIHGGKKALNELRERIHSQDPTLVADPDGLFTWFETGQCYGLVQEPEDFEDPVDYCLMVDFTSKWGPPQDELLELAQAYPSLKFQVVYEEQGNGVYGLLHYEHGRNTNTCTFTEEEYLKEYDECYREDLAEVTKTSYKRFLTRFIVKGGIADEHPDPRITGNLERNILARVEDKDLPLLTNHKWFYEGNSKQFETRLKSNPMEVSNVK
jgi:hypothetical protein